MRASVIIEKILRDHPSARSSDKELYILVWEQFGFFMSAVQKAQFRGLPPSETIRRVRQKLQEEGKYPADHKIKGHRKFAALTVQQRISQTKSEKVQQLLEEKPEADPAQEQISII